MNAHELNQRLCDQIGSVLKNLFPAGKIVRGEYEVGDLSGAAGDSLKIHLAGVKKGFWSDFATGAKGKSLLGLWAESLGGDFAAACRAAKAFLGIDDRFERRFHHPIQKTPAPQGVDYSKVRKLDPEGFVATYLMEERKIELPVLLAYSVGESSDGRAAVFPFFKVVEEPEVTLEEKAYFVKFLKVERPDGKKEIWTQPSNVQDSLFGKGATLPKSVTQSGDLVITEGELDALTVAQFGYYGVSVPRGAKHATEDGKSANDSWIAADYMWLANFERIFIWMDSDEPGRRAAADIAKRIGLERCYLVATPRGLKDANECLCAEVPAEEIALAFENAITLDPANLSWAGNFRDKVFRRLFPLDGIEPGFELPWALPWRIRPGEMTVWTGFSGHGKTVMLSHLMVHLADQGQRICVASMEVEPDKTLETVWCQANGARFPFTDKEAETWDAGQRERVGETRFNERYEWVAERFLLFMPEVDSIGVGRADWRTLMECFLYARQRYGCEQFVVDSMMMCVGRSETEYHEVELFVNALSAFSKRHQVHVHLVAHSRKKEDEAKPPGKQDVAGPKETADIAHNVAVVQRNMKKHSDRQKLERELAGMLTQTGLTGELLDKWKAEKAEIEKRMADNRLLHDGELHLLKQRNGDGEVASKYLFFLVNCRQFVAQNPWVMINGQRGRAKRFIPALAA